MNNFTTLLTTKLKIKLWACFKKNLLITLLLNLNLSDNFINTTYNLVNNYEIACKLEYLTAPIKENNQE